MADTMNLRDDVEESLTGNEGGTELPSQGGPSTPTIMPGIHLFKLPPNIDQLWEAKDFEKKDKDGNVVMGPDGKPIVEQHLFLKFDKENPMVCVDGDRSQFDGLPATTVFSTIPRRRGKGDNAPVVADIAYLLRDGFNDSKTPVVKRREWIPAINKYPGAVVRLETGLSAQCDPDRVRYVDDGAGGVMEDPDGTKGCGNPAAKANLAAGKETRLYTKDFEVQLFQVVATQENYNTKEEALEAATALGQTGAGVVKPVKVFVERVWCKTCSAALRGFFRVERILKPIGQQSQ